MSLDPLPNQTNKKKIGFKLLQYLNNYQPPQFRHLQEFFQGHCQKFYDCHSHDKWYFKFYDFHKLKITIFQTLQIFQTIKNIKKRLFQYLDINNNSELDINIVFLTEKGTVTRYVTSGSHISREHLRKNIKKWPTHIQARRISLIEIINLKLSWWMSFHSRLLPFSGPQFSAPSTITEINWEHQTLWKNLIHPLNILQEATAILRQHSTNKSYIFMYYYWHDNKSVL